jgi:hypothetical protein
MFVAPAALVLASASASASASPATPFPWALACESAVWNVSCAEWKRSLCAIFRGSCAACDGERPCAVRNVCALRSAAYALSSMGGAEAASKESGRSGGGLDGGVMKLSEVTE